MESLGMVILLLSVGVYSWAVLGLIKPVSAGLPNRWASVPVWIGSVVLFIIGASFIEDGDTTPASSASRVPQAAAVAEPVEVDCADWDTAAFFEAAEASDVIRCLQEGADPNARGESGDSPLHRAALSGSPFETAVALLNAGADLNALDGLGGTPLQLAAAELGPPEMVTALLNAGADLNARNERGRTALHSAAWSGTAATVTALLNAGADLNVRDESGDTPLHSAAWLGGAEVVGTLLNAGADLNALGGLGGTPLKQFMAAWRGTPETVTALLNAGADPNARNERGETPLFEAADLGSLGTVTALLNAGADPNARSESGDTPLRHAAMRNGNAGVAMALLGAGADPNARTNNGNTPLHNAKSIEAVTMLLEAGADPNARRESGWTPLHSASTAEVVTALLEAGADLEARAGLFGSTPLHRAARNGTAAMVTALLAAGADPHVRDSDGKLPFDYAEDNDELKGTDAYWKLNDARFQSREIGEGVFDVGGDPITTPTRRQAPVPSQALPQHPLDRALYLRDEITRYVVEPCAMWLTQLQVPIKPDVPVDVLTQINELEAHMLFGDKRVLVAVATEMETSAARLSFYEEEKSQCIELLERRHGLLSMAASSPVDLETDIGNTFSSVREPDSDSSGGSSAGGGDVTMPTLLTQVLPEYSREAREAEYQGTVILEAIVRRDGTVDVVRVARSLPFGLNEKAIEAVRQWRFRPGMRNGEPVDVELKIEVNFNLRSAGFSR